MPDRCVVPIEELTPLAVAQLPRTLGRAHDVREQHGGENAVRLLGLAHTRQELLDLVHDLVAAACRRDVVLACELDVACAGDAPGEEAGVLDMTDLVADAVDDQRWGGDRRHDVADVDVVRHAHEHLGRSR